LLVNERFGFAAEFKTTHTVMKKHYLLSRCALVTVLLTNLNVTPSFANYGDKAEQATDYIQAHFYDQTTERYWRTYPSTGDYAWTWGNGVQLYALAEAVKHSRKKYIKVLDEFPAGMQGYWDSAASVPGYSDYCFANGRTSDYYDDNEWLVMAYVNAYQATHDKKFLTYAANTQKFVLSGWDNVLGGGIYWDAKHLSKNTCSNAPAEVAALMLADSTNDQTQVDWAVKIRQWTNQNLRDADDLYFDNVDLNGRISKAKYSYNTALPISADLLLYERTKDASYLNDAIEIGDAALAQWTDPATGSLQRYDDQPIFSHLLSQSFIELYQTTHDLKYLDAVRREASFAYRYGRDSDGGYWDHWTVNPQKADQAKSLIGNASAAYLFWILAPYPDVEELKTAGQKAVSAGDYATAQGLFQQAVASDPQDTDAKTMLDQTHIYDHETGTLVDQSSVPPDLSVAFVTPELTKGDIYLIKVRGTGGQPLHVDLSTDKLPTFTSSSNQVQYALIDGQGSAVTISSTGSFKKSKRFGYVIYDLTGKPTILGRPIETVHMPVIKQLVTSTTTTESGSVYVLNSDGDAQVGGAGLGRGDADYMDYGADGHGATDIGDFNTDYGLGVDDTDPSISPRTHKWGAFRLDHNYYMIFVGTGKPIDFLYYDTNYGDNSTTETLTVNIYPAP
jgi:rhamnogalacturonyl hydrolase YesR